MTSTVTNPISRPVRSKSETKSEITDTVARAIMQGEADARTTKTIKLRNARLAMEARQAEPKSSKSRNETAQKNRPRPAAIVAPVTDC